MSFTTLIGFLAGLGLFVGAIVTETSNYMIFLSFSSALMVVGGTLAATLIAQEARYVWLAIKGIASTLAPQRVGRGVLNREVGRVIRWGYLVQSKGILALEDEAKKVKGDEFLNFGVELILAGSEGNIVGEVLFNTAGTTFGRNMAPVFVLKKMGATAPAFGMIGTLIGLIIMLDSMGSDPSALGAGLAVALCTTLYGVLLAQLVLMPAAAKLEQRLQIARFRNELMAEGLALLADRTSPRQIQDRMNSYLDPAIRFDIDQQLKGGGAQAEAAE
ncbi:MAG: MotA/TolQ/ExbB proton channel family protein [Alphaproteobacteria bacterium]|nr:MotA/TolQ/ExbB proton channel family protein [Alphaproteobacteria bacterium]